MFTVNDYANLHKMLERGKFDGLAEAEVAVVLASKLRKAVEELQKPAQTEVVLEESKAKKAK